MTQKTKWIYFFSKDYEFWHKHLQSRLTKNFDLEPILIPTLNASSNGKDHHFSGISLKIELIIKSIKENIGRSIIFSDCTLWINENKTEQLRRKIDQLKDKYDLIFADNGFDREANIGITLIGCNQATLDFYKKILKSFDKSSWDQKAINNALPGIGFLRLTKCKKIHQARYLYQSIRKFFNKKSIIWSLFKKSEIVCDYHLPKELQENYFIFKQFIQPSDPVNNYNQRLIKLHECGLLESSDLSRNLRH